MLQTIKSSNINLPKLKLVQYTDVVPALVGPNAGELELLYEHNLNKYPDVEAYFKSSRTGKLFPFLPSVTNLVLFSDENDNLDAEFIVDENNVYLTITNYATVDRAIQIYLLIGKDGITNG